MLLIGSRVHIHALSRSVCSVGILRTRHRNLYLLNWRGMEAMCQWRFALDETATDPRAVGVCAMLYLLAHVSAPRDTKCGLGVSSSVLGWVYRAGGTLEIVPAGITTF